MRVDNSKARSGPNPDLQGQQIPWDTDATASERWSRLPVADCELSEADIRYSVRFKSRRAPSSSAAHKGGQRRNTQKATAGMTKKPSSSDRLYLAYALVIGLLAGLGIPSAVVLVAVLVVNPSAISAIFSQLIFAAMSAG